MARILLSQSQVSVIVSSTIIALFTFLLFLAGYILQQQTITGLQAAIKPRVPQRPISLTPIGPSPAEPILPRSRLFHRHPSGHITSPDLHFPDDADAAAAIDWSRRAHVQLVRGHRDVCNAIMLLADLHRLRSPARRVLLFPRAWAEEKRAAKGEVSDPWLDSSRRLLRRAARRYGVELRPISPIMERAGSGTRGEGDGAEGTYSLASVYGLQAEFDRVLVVETPGLVFDAEPLDAVLGFTESAPLAMLYDATADEGVHAEDLFLIEPSGATFDGLVGRLQERDAAGFNDTRLASLFPDPLLLASSSDDSALVRSIGVLHEVDEGFNRTAFLSDVSYLRFSDPKLPGPQYDVPWPQKVAARPVNKDADWVWTSLYGDFAQKRLEICGLDLESWRP